MCIEWHNMKVREREYEARKTFLSVAKLLFGGVRLNT